MDGKDVVWCVVTSFVMDGKDVVWCVVTNGFQEGVVETTIQTRVTLTLHLTRSSVGQKSVPEGQLFMIDECLANIDFNMDSHG